MFVLLLLTTVLGSGAVRLGGGSCAYQGLPSASMQDACTKELMEEADQQDTLCEIQHTRTEDECVLAALTLLFPDGEMVAGPENLGEGVTSKVDMYQIYIQGVLKTVAVKVGGWTHYFAGDADAHDKNRSVGNWDTHARWADEDGRSSIRENVFGLAWKNEFQMQKHAGHLGTSPYVFGVGQCVKRNLCMLTSRANEAACEYGASVCGSSYEMVPLQVGSMCCVSEECGNRQQGISGVWFRSPGFTAIPDLEERTSHLGVLVMEAKLDLTTGTSARTLGDHLKDTVLKCIAEEQSLSHCVQQYKAPPDCALGLLQSAFCAIESVWRGFQIDLWDSHLDNFLVVENECSPAGDMSRHAVQIIDYGAARSRRGDSKDFLEAQWDFIEDLLGAGSVEGNFTEEKGRKALAEAGLLTLESPAGAICPGKQLRATAPEFVPVSSSQELNTSASVLASVSEKVKVATALPHEDEVETDLPGEVGTVLPPSRVCQIKEEDNSGSLVQYGINFALDVGACRESFNCNFFNFKAKLLKNFIEPPVRIPPEGRVGRCPCMLKLEGEQEARSMQAVRDTGEDVLVDFVASKEEPCNETLCWDKYSQFLYIDKGSKGKVVGSSANHWNIKCVDGTPSLAGLKDFTVRKVYSRATPKEQAEMKAQAGGIFLPPSVEPLSEDPNVTAIGSKNLSVEQGIAKAETHMLEGDREENLSIITRSSTAGDTQGEIDMSIDSTRSVVGGRESHQQLQRAAAAAMSVLQVIEMQKIIEQRLAADIEETRRYVESCALLMAGRVEKKLEPEFLVQTTATGELIVKNLKFLKQRLGGNLDPMTAFYAATEAHAPNDVRLQQLLKELTDAMALQHQLMLRLATIANDIEQSVWVQPDSVWAHKLAQESLTQLETMLRDLEQHRGGIETAYRAFE